MSSLIVFGILIVWLLALTGLVVAFHLVVVGLLLLMMRISKNREGQDNSKPEGWQKVLGIVLLLLGVFLAIASIWFALLPLGAPSFL